MVNDESFFLVTGCARSGTGYFSKMLKLNGHTCGHEISYGIRNIKNFGNNLRSSESSWLAVPYVNKHLNCKIIKLFRDPFSTIKSNVDLSLLSPRVSHSLYQKHIIKNIPEIIISENDIIKNTAIYYVKWNELFDKLIEDNYYELVHFNSLIANEREVKLFNENFKFFNGVVNSKKKGKQQDVSKEFIIETLKKCGMYKIVLNTYNKMLTHKKRKV